MPMTMASSGHGVDLVARLHDRPPFVVRGDTLRAAASAMRTLLAAEARNESRWPAGCGLRFGSITGRPYVGKVARDERAEGVAA